MSGFLLGTISDIVGDLTDKIFCDAFAGTGAVGNAFKPHVKQLISNDLEHYSYVLNRNYIGNCIPLPDAKYLISELNDLTPISDGFIFQNFCLGSGSGRQYFSDENGQKIDAARQAIERWHNSGDIDDDRYYFLICSLLECADRLANTASVYGAFLKKLKPIAQKRLVLSPADFTYTNQQNEVYQEDANALLRHVKGDILYLDPPYNVRQYGANYHILNIISQYQPVTLKGKTGIHKYRRSLYCSRKKVFAAFDDLMSHAEFQYTFLSYNNEGLLSPDFIRETMQKYGEYDCISMRHQRFKADSDENRTHHAQNTTEYLHLMIKKSL